MKVLGSLALVLTFAATPMVANADSHKHKDKFAATMEFDSAFETIFLGSWTHEFSKQFSLKTQLDILANFKTMNFWLRGYYKTDDVKLGLGAGASFGPGSFGIPLAGVPDRTKFKLGRDLLTYILAEYSPSIFLFHVSSSLFLPIQESHDTALWVLYVTTIAAISFDGWMIGPFFEPFFVKEGSRVLEASELRVGGYIEKSVGPVTLSLFAGYDPYERALYLGAPKEPGFIARGAISASF